MQDAAKETEVFDVALRRVPIFLFHQDVDLVYTWVFNPSGVVPRTAAAGQTDAHLFTKAHAAKLAALKQHVLNRLESLQEDLELSIRGKPGWYRLSLSPQYSPEGAVTGVTGSMLNITRERRREQELRKAVEAAEASSLSKSAFLATMSHEIRTPLTSVIGFASVLSRELSGEQREFAQTIETSGKRLLDMLGLVLTLAKLDAQQAEVQLEPIDVGAEVHAIVELLRPLAEDKGLGLSIASDAAAMPACLDRGALSSIAYNLIGNAIKYTDEGEVRVSVRVEGGAVVAVAVEDTGTGIDAAFLPHVFDAFKQEAQAGRTSEGVGLGLALTKRLVEIMNGAIDVESRKGEGSRFTVTFPLAVSEEGAHTLENPYTQSDRPASGRATILLVEDNPDTRFLLEHILEEYYDVSASGAPEEALQEAAARRIDLVLMDINLSSDRTGLDVMHALRQIPGHEHTPVIALTAYALPGDRERFIRDGFNDYLPKPFAVDDLLDLIRHSLLGAAVEK